MELILKDRRLKCTKYFRLNPILFMKSTPISMFLLNQEINDGNNNLRIDTRFTVNGKIPVKTIYDFYAKIKKGVISNIEQLDREEIRSVSLYKGCSISKTMVKNYFTTNNSDSDACVIKQSIPFRVDTKHLYFFESDKGNLFYSEVDFCSPTDIGLTLRELYEKHTGRNPNTLFSNFPDCSSEEILASKLIFSGEVMTYSKNKEDYVHLYTGEIKYLIPEEVLIDYVLTKNNAPELTLESIEFFLTALNSSDSDSIKFALESLAVHNYIKEKRLMHYILNAKRENNYTFYSTSKSLNVRTMIRICNKKIN